MSRAGLAACLAVVLAARLWCAVQDPTAAYLMPSLRLDGPLWGALVAVGTVAPSRLLLGLCAGVWALGPLLVAPLGYGPAQVAVSAATALGGGVCAALAWDGRLAVWLAHPALVWLGGRSYGVYLLHRPALEMTGCPWAGAALALVLAEGSWRLIEAPAIDWGRR